MRRGIWAAALGIVVAAGLIYFASSVRGQEESTGSSASVKAAEFALTDIDGKPVKLSDYKGKVVILDFWATWCPPCRMIGPAIEAAADRFAGQAKVAKLDVDDNPAVASRYGICSIPTLLLFQDGRVVEQRVGALPKAEIEAMVERPLLAAAASAAR